MTLSEQTREQERIEARLDVERLLPLIERHLPDCRESLELTGGRVLSIQLRPGSQCLGHYELTFRMRDSGEEVSQNVFVTLTDEAPWCGIDPTGYCDLGLPIGTAETEIPEISAVMYPAVLDPGLPGLTRALDREAIKRHLEPVARAQGFPVKSVRTRLMSHTPGARATIRYRLFAGKSGKSGKQWTAVVGKLNAHKDLASIMANYQALWQCTSGSFAQARPLGTIQSLGMSLQTMIEGKRINTYTRSPQFPAMLESVGEALAAVHRAPLPVERVRDPKREIKSFTTRARLLAAVVPDSARLERLVGRLTDAVAAHSRVSGVVHGDFHHANVMANDAGIALIDFDEMGLGDPALDAGRFAVSLSVPSLRAYGDLRLLDVARAHFLRTYLDRTGTDSRRVRIFEAAAFIISALTLWRLSRAGWDRHLPGLIGLAENALDEAVRRPPPPAREAGAPPLGFDQARRWAEDPAYLRQLMKAAVYRRHGAEIHETEVAASADRDREVWLSCRMRGTTATGRWSGTAEGVCLPGLRTRAIGRLIDALAAAPGHAREAFEIPVLLGMNQRLGLLLWESRDAPGLFEGGCEAPPRAQSRAAACLARFLAQLQGSESGSAPSGTVAEFLARRKLPAPTAPGLNPTETVVPSPIAPRLADFGIRAGRIVIRRPDRLGLAPALMAAAEIERALAGEVGPEAAARFRAEYLAATGRDRAELDAWAELVAERSSSPDATP